MAPAALDPETTTVSFTLLGLERARDRGRILGLASAEILLAGVTVTLQGIRIIYVPDGSLLVQPPRFRHPDSRWLPAVILPPELAHAIAAEVLDAFDPRRIGPQHSPAHGLRRCLAPLAMMRCWNPSKSP